MARRLLRSTPVVETSALDAGDAASTVTSVLRAARNGKGGVIESITVVDKAEQSAELQIFLFIDEPASPAALDAAFALTDAVLAANLIGVVTIPAANYIVELGGAGVQSIAVLRKVKLGFVLPANKNKLWYQLRVTGTPTYAAADALTLIFDIDQE